MVESKDGVAWEKDTYLIEYQCYNCGTKFVTAVPLGMEACGKGGKCPYCGVDDNLTDEEGWAHDVLGPPHFGD